MTTVQFRVGEQAYPVHVGGVDAEGVLSVLREHGYTSLFLLSDENVWRRHGARFEQLGEALVLPPGESAKSPEVWSRCHSWLASKGADRRSMLLLVGGGVIGDLGGFLAATYMRGIRFATVATTLLAQIDAAVGGKTAINLPEGKNLVGAFHHPLAVWCDPAFLSTLPDEEYRNGMAEAIKYGFIRDADLLCRIESSTGRLRRLERSPLEAVIRRCCELKAEIVAADPEERLGIRAVLNFGHTVGHALEQAQEYGGLAHGEAVMVGMIAETEIGRRLGLTPEAARERLEDVAEAWELPTRLPEQGLVERMVTAMRRDKKASGGKMAMSLLDGVGSCRLVRDVDVTIVEEVLQSL
ncbi:MAG: 3-dehydroquinate synthase [Armatimonadetes bacterium]|nr:3-dehydroquinate synthase [Armatimonadota bacterium]